MLVVPVDFGKREERVEVCGERAVVRDEQEGHRCTVAQFRFDGDFGQERQEGLAAVGIEGGGGFIGDDQRRGADDGSGDGDALLLSDGEMGYGSVEVAVDVEATRQAFDFAGERRRGDTGSACRVEVAGQGDILFDREVGDEIEALEDVSDLRAAQRVAGGCGEVGEVLAQDVDASLLRHEHSGDEGEERGLAAAGWPVEKAAMTCLDAKLVDPKDRVPGSIGKANVAKVYCVCGHQGAIVIGE